MTLAVFHFSFIFAHIIIALMETAHSNWNSDYTPSELFEDDLNQFFTAHGLLCED